MVVVIFGNPNEYIFLHAGRRFPTNKIAFIRQGTIQTNKIMLFGILFNSYFSLCNSFIEMITREIHFNKKSFLTTLKTSQFIW